MVRVVVVAAVLAGCGAVAIPVADEAPAEQGGGKRAPGFEAVDQRGAEVSLDEAVSSSAVALIFYRGAW